MTDINRLARDYCIDYICGMSMSLVTGNCDRFDFFYDMCLSSMKRITDKDTRHQVDALVQKLYTQRFEKH